MNLQQEVRLLWRLPETDCLHGGDEAFELSARLFRRSGGMDRCADSTCAILFLYDAEMEDYRDKNTKADMK